MKIKNLVDRLNADPDIFPSLSTGEQIAAAFLMGRLDLLPEGYKHPMDALCRLGSEWREEMTAFWQGYR